MRQYVDIEGSGEDVTIINGTAVNYGVVLGATNAGLRRLTVRSTGAGGSTYQYAIYNNNASTNISHVRAYATGGAYGYGIYNNASSPVITDVDASGDGTSAGYGIYNNSASPNIANTTATGTTRGTGVAYGIYNYTASPIIGNTTAMGTTSGTGATYGIYNFSSSPLISNSLAIATNGVVNTGGTLKIHNSVIKGTASTVYAPSGTVNIANSQLDGGAVSGGGALKCVGAYNGSFVALATNCQ